MLLGKNTQKVIVALTLIMLLLGCGNNYTPEEYIAAAKASLKEGKNNEAIISLKNVLKLDAKNSEARLLLGITYLQEGIWLLAEKELDRVLELGNKNMVVLPLLAQVYYHLNNSSAISELIANNLSADANILIIPRTYLGLSYIRDGEVNFAKVVFEQIISDNIESPYTKVSQSWATGLNNDYDNALQLIDEVISSPPVLDIAIISKAQFLFAKDEMSKAAEAYGAFLAVHPKDLYSRLMLALSLAKASDYQAAEKQVDVILKNLPSQPLGNEIKSQIRFVDKDYAQAKHFAELALRRNNNLLISRVVAGISAYQLKEPELAYSHLVKIKDQLSLKHPAQRLLNSLRLQLGYVDENIAALSAAPLEELDVELLTSSAQELFNLGRVDTAERLLSKASTIAPEDGFIDFQMGIQKLLNNDDSAGAFFEAAFEKNPDEDTVAAMKVLKLIDEKNYEQAIEITNGIKKRNEELAYGLMAAIFKRQEKYDLAEIELKKVVELNNKQVGALYSLADLAKQKNNLEAAIGYYQEILIIDPDQVHAINALLKYVTNSTYQAEIKLFFESNITNSAGNATASLALAEYFVFQQQFNEAENILAKALLQHPTDLRLNLLLAKIYMYHKDYASALNQVDAYIQFQDREPRAYLAKALIYNEMGDKFNALQSQIQAVKLQPNDFVAQTDLVAFYLANNKLPEAKKILASLASSPQVTLKIKRLKGKVAFMEQNYQDAIKFLQPIYKEVNSQDIILEIVQSMQNLGQEAQAIKIIDEVSNRIKSDIPVVILLKQAELYSKQGQPENAIVIYNQLLKRTNNHFAISNNLAWALLAQGDTKQALEQAKLAIKEAPDEVIVQNTFGVVSLAAGKNEQALTYLKKSYEAEQANSNYTLHYIQALLINNQKQVAKELLQRLDGSTLSADSLKRLVQVKEEI
ncbi:XrtA/PEP-CTERM system TPR-repeat protein PrsT [Colwellia sp. MB3u-4]|uniref:XrtA/PEP-CTERM system TPR-repeat protein PrsT n=1 Tax=Colwellia sp. MB3u-4 TaxID=2759822 RepID=UPI0015F3FCC9|nr:XrtA/PEP-CTERM system TPR-repeat protein PrsT [Colwellia sp. MB3u-4]MBA6290417.1 PEP-CTERM system TPR-repeat protein PrsT [Colwellia sp. MB3u-4]